MPDSWPTAPPPRHRFVAPLFPLPGAFLFPRQVLPLYIFEHRYREMIEDSLDGPGKLVIGTIPESEAHLAKDLENPPQVRPVAGLGEIVRHEKTEDGCFHLWLFGLSRVLIEERNTETPYRRVEVTPLLEVEPDATEVKRLYGPLCTAILARSKELLNLPDDIPTDMLVDLLSQRLRVPQVELENIYSEPDVCHRAQLALAAHHSYPVPEENEDG